MFTSFDIFNQDNRSLNLMLLIFKTFIKQQFQNIINKNESKCTDNPKDVINNTDYIDDFITFYTTYTQIINQCFSNNNLFNVTYKEVLENIQSDNNKFNNSYILPFYLDKYLKRSSNNSNNTILQQIIENVLSIFPTLPDKDVFIDIHRNLVMI